MKRTLNLVAALAAAMAVTAFASLSSAQPQPAQALQTIEIIRLDPKFDKLVPPNVIVERIVSGCTVLS